MVTATISPDGSMLAEYVEGGAAGFWRDAQEDQSRESKISFAGTPDYRFRSSIALAFHQLGPVTNAGFRFTPDGKAVAFVLAEKGIENIWTQPLDGGKPRKLTNFDSRQIQDFGWSRDGKHLAIIRNEYTDDVILLRDTSRSAH